MKRIIVDITQLAHWQGKITGIPRVMDELARRFYGLQNTDVIFAVWVKDIKEFCEVDFDRTIVQRDGVIYRRSGEDISVQLVAKTVVAAKSSLSVSGLRRHAVRVAKKGIAVTSRISPGLSRKMESRAKQAHMQSYKRIEFHKADLFIIPWGEWWDPSFTDRLVAAHDEGARLIQIIHDMATTVWPQFFEQVRVNPATYNARIVPIADLVLAVSKNTKKELVQWLQKQKLHIPKIEVFRLGDDLRVTIPQKPKEQTFVNSKLKGQDYILCVGTIEAKKNHTLFYYVYKLAKARGIELPKLAIVGRRGWHTGDIYDLMSLDPEVKEKFVFLHNISDAELSWLYDNCLFTALASFHEGWGIPIAESLGRGVPCVSSNTSSMVEIAEGIVEHFSPTSSDECLEVIQKLLDPKELKRARQRAKNYEQFSWDDSFKQVKSYMEEL